MRVILDTNVWVSALLVETSPPARLLTLWRQRGFTVLTATEQLEELARVTRYPKIRARLHPALAGRLVNELRDLAVLVKKVPVVDVSPDPADNYLLALASAGRADYLVTGDKHDLLALRQYEGTHLLSVKDFLSVMRIHP